MNSPDQCVLVNTNEQIIMLLAEDLVEETDMCHCEKCFKDVCAIALNRFRGNYVTSKKGELIAGVMKNVPENKAEMLVAISRAIERVKNNPMHDMAETKTTTMKV